MGIQLVNVALLTVVLAYFLYKPVVKYLNTRSERIQNEIEAARKERDEAMEMKERYEVLIAGVENEREEVLHQAYKKAVEKSDQMLFDARREAELLFEKAHMELETEKQNHMDEIKRQIIEISTLMAGKIVEINTDQSVHNRLIEEAMADWRES
jgi:F-type H+-transporting ATPase subunit b